MRRRPSRLLAGLCVAAFLFAACGGDDDDSAGDTPAGDDATGGSGDDAAGDDGTGDDSGETVDDTEPVRGGTLVYAVEADTSSPWTPQAMVCAAACYSTVGRTVFEPLVLVGDDGNTYPYLLESITPNEDYTVWTLVVRDGITFHDGTPLDGPAVAYNLNATQNAALVGLAVGPMDTVTDDGAMTVTVTMSTSWPSFDYYLNSQLGLMASPTWLEAVAAGTAQASAPVGTGPFVYESYESGENGRFTATRNENYWRGDSPESTGEGLPYLDGIEVRFMPDSQARTQALQAGDLDLIQTANGVEIGDLREEEGLVVDTMEHPGEVETGYLLINNSESLPDGTPNPFSDIRVRQAVAYATNNEILSETRAGGVYPVANGPFPPGRAGYLEDSGQLEFDPDAAAALVEEIEAENGPLVVALKTTTDPFNLTTSKLLKDMWEEVGMEVTIDQIPQGEFINEALAGNFEIFTWRNHSGVSPDSQFVWWSSTTTSGIALNFGRIDDPEVDRLLEAIRTNTDEAARTAAAEDLNRYMNEQVFNVWNTWTFWGFAHPERVHNAGTFHIPGAPEGVTSLIGGVITPIEMFETD